MAPIALSAVYKPLFYNQICSVLGFAFNSSVLCVENSACYLGSDLESELKYSNTAVNGPLTFGPSKHSTKGKAHSFLKMAHTTPDLTGRPLFIYQAVFRDLSLTYPALHPSWGRWLKGFTRICSWLSLFVNQQCAFSFVLTKPVSQASSLYERMIW